MQTWLAGEIDLRVKRVQGVTHLELFDDRWHSYCDLAMFEEKKSEFTRELPLELCPDCHKIFIELAAKAR